MKKLGSRHRKGPYNSQQASRQKAAGLANLASRWQTVRGARASRASQDKLQVASNKADKTITVTAAAEAPRCVRL